jgi:methyl-accepting chemotaxis protein
MEWFNNRNVKTKLMLSFSVLLAMIVGVGSLAIASLSSANGRIKTLYQDDLTGAIMVDNILMDRYNMAKANRDALLNMIDPQKVSEDEKAIHVALADLHKNLEGADRHFYLPQGKAYLAEMAAGLPVYESANRMMVEAVRAKDLTKAKAGLVAVAKAGKPISDAGEKARALTLKVAADASALDDLQYSRSRVIVMVACGVSMLLAVSLSLILAGGISDPLQRAVLTLERVAAGDLTVSLDVQTEEEVGRMAAALNAALGKLRSTLQTVTDTAVSVSASSQELASAADALASGSQEQAASLEETSASLEEITATVRQSADSARQANQLAASSRELAETGQATVSEAVSAMQEISVASVKISNIISTIDDIAFQTNLLAVNAAVEAARAGDEGRGFAVVAAEVRNLALRSATEAKAIKALVRATLEKVERGTILVNRSGQTLQNIVDSVRRVTDIVGEISASADEQSSGIEQINIAMTQIDQVTQSNSAQTEELSSTAQTLSEQSVQMTLLVGSFKLTDGNAEDAQQRGFVEAPVFSRSLYGSA